MRARLSWQDRHRSGLGDHPAAPVAGVALLDGQHQPVGEAVHPAQHLSRQRLGDGAPARLPRRPRPLRTHSHARLTRERYGGHGPSTRINGEKPAGPADAGGELPPPRGDSRGSGRRGIQSEPLAVSQGQWCLSGREGGMRQTTRGREESVKKRVTSLRSSDGDSPGGRRRATGAARAASRARGRGRQGAHGRHRHAGRRPRCQPAPRPGGARPLAAGHRRGRGRAAAARLARRADPDPVRGRRRGAQGQRPRQRRRRLPGQAVRLLRADRPAPRPQAPHRPRPGRAAAGVRRPGGRPAGRGRPSSAARCCCGSRPPSGSCSRRWSPTPASC